MTYLRTEMEPNGNTFTPVRYYKCNRCGAEIYEGFPHSVVGDDNHYCADCTYALGYITDKQYQSWSGTLMSGSGSQTNDGIRRSSRYKNWRLKVLERDSYTCQHCRRTDSELHVHHIKSFAKYEKLRFEVSNGLTLCPDCHKEIHKKQ